MSRTINRATLDLITSFEGFRAVAYLCPAGIPTIGWGHTKTVSHADVGKKRITRSQGLELKAQDLADAERALARVVRPKALARLADNQYGALVSFVYNLGANPSWTIWKRVNAGALDAVPDELFRFTFALNPKTGRREQLAGLIRRRRAEIDLWRADAVSPIQDTDNAALGFAVIEGPMPHKPAARSQTMWGGIVAGVSGMGAAAGAAVEQLGPLAMWSEHVATIVGVLALIAAIGGIWVAVRRYMDERDARGAA
jgi:GH24 family phage-related lysozyme (muramidase)